MSILDKSSHHVPAKQLSSRNDKNVSFKKSSEPQSRIIQEKSYLESDFLTGGTASFAFPSDFGLQTPAISSFASPSKSVVPLTEYHEKIRRKQIQQPIISRDSPHPKADVINTRVVSPLSSLEKRNKKEIPVSFTPSHLPPSPLKSIAPPRKFAPDFGNPQFAVEKTTDISDSFLNPEKIAPLRTNQKKLHFETDASLFQDSFHSILPNPISASSLLLDKPFFDSQETNDSMKVPSTISHPISSKSTKDFSGPSILPIQQSSQQPLSKDSIESKSSDMSTFSFLPSDVQLHFSKSNNPSKRLPLSNDTNASRYSFNETRLTSSPVYPSSMISSFPTESHPSISYSTGSELFSTTTVPSSSSFHTTLFSHNTPSSTSEDLKAFHMMAKIFRFWRAEATKSAKRKRAINRRLAKEQKADNFFLRKTGRRLLKHWLFEAVPASQKENEKLLMEADRFREDVLLAKGLRALAINKDLLQRKKKAEKLALSFFTNKRQAFYFHIWKNWAKEKKPALPLTPMQIISLFMLMGLPVEQILRVCVECFADIVQINEEIQKKEDNEEEVDSSSFSYLLPIMNKLPERAIAYPFLKKSYDFSSVHSCFFNCHNSSEKSTQTSLSLAQATPYDKNTSGSSFQFKVARQEQSLQLFFSSQDETTNFDNSASMLDQSKQNCPEVIDIVSRLSTHLTQPLYFCIEANRSRAIRTRDQSPFIFCIRKSKVLPPFHLLSVSTSSPSPSSFSSASSLALLSIEAQNRIPISFSLLPQRICPSSSLHRFLISLKILSSSLLRPVFNHWRRIAHKRALFKERHLLRMKKMMFTQWNEAYVQDYCYQKREIRQRAELVRRMCSNKVKRAAFGEWLAATEKRMDLKNRRMQLEKDLLLNRMKSQLYEWNILAWERKEENKNTQKALALYSATISRKILWEWNLIAREQQDLRELLQNVREQRESKERTTLMRVAWDVWIESMEKLSEEKEKALTCIEHWAMIRLKDGFHKLKMNCLIRKQNRINKELANKFITTQRLRKSFKALINWYNEKQSILSKKKIAFSFYSNSAKKKCFDLWKEKIDGIHRQKQNINILNDTFRHILCRCVFNSWRNHNAQVKLLKEGSKKIENLHKILTINSAFNGWKKCYEHENGNKMEANAFHNKKIQSKAFYSFKKVTKYQINTKDLCNKLTMQRFDCKSAPLKRSAFECWLKLALQKRRLLLSVVSYISEKRKQTVKAMFQCWKDRVFNKQRINSLQISFVEQKSKVKARQILVAWHALQERREKLAILRDKVELMFVQRTLYKTFTAWKHRSSVFHKAEVALDSFRMQRAFGKWKTLLKWKKITAETKEKENHKLLSKSFEQWKNIAKEKINIRNLLIQRIQSKISNFAETDDWLEIITSFESKKDDVTAFQELMNSLKSPMDFSSKLSCNNYSENKASASHSISFDSNNDSDVLPKQERIVPPSLISRKLSLRHLIESEKKGRNIKSNDSDAFIQIETSIVSSQVQEPPIFSLSSKALPSYKQCKSMKKPASLSFLSSILSNASLIQRVAEALNKYLRRYHDVSQSASLFIQMKDSIRIKKYFEKWRDYSATRSSELKERENCWNDGKRKWLIARALDCWGKWIVDRYKNERNSEIERRYFAAKCLRLWNRLTQHKIHLCEMLKQKELEKVDVISKNSFYKWKILWEEIENGKIKRRFLILSLYFAHWKKISTYLRRNKNIISTVRQLHDNNTKTTVFHALQLHAKQQMSIRTFQLNVDLKVLRKAFIEWKRRIAEKKEKNAKVEQWKRNSKRAVNAIWGGIQSERSVPIRSRSKASLKSLTRSEIAYNPTNDWDEIWTPAANLEAKDTEKKVSFELPTFTPQDASLRKVNAVSSSPSQRRVSTFSSSSTVQTPTAEKGVMTSPITPSGNRYDSLMPKPTVPFSEALPLSSRLSEKSSQDHHSNHSRQVISTPSRQVLTETNSAREATQNSEKPHFTDIIAPEECEISAEPNVQTEFVPESSASSFKAKSELTRRQIAERMSELMAPTQTAQVSKETNCFQATKELQDGQMEERTPNRRRTSASPQLISLNDYQTPNRPRSQSASPTAIKSTPKSFSKSKNASPRSLIIIPPDEKNMHQSPSSERTSLCETPKQAKNNIYFDLKENNKNTSIPRIPLSPLRDYITPFTSEDKVLPTTFKDEDDEYEQSSNDEDSLIEHAESEDESHSGFPFSLQTPHSYHHLHLSRTKRSTYGSNFLLVSAYTHPIVPLQSYLHYILTFGIEDNSHQTTLCTRFIHQLISHSSKQQSKNSSQKLSDSSKSSAHSQNIFVLNETSFLCSYFLSWMAYSRYHQHKRAIHQHIRTIHNQNLLLHSLSSFRYNVFRNKQKSQAIEMSKHNTKWHMLRTWKIFLEEQKTRKTMKRSSETLVAFRFSQKAFSLWKEKTYEQIHNKKNEQKSIEFYEKKQMTNSLLQWKKFSLNEKEIENTLVNEQISKHLFSLKKDIFQKIKAYAQFHSELKSKQRSIRNELDKERLHQYFLDWLVCSFRVRCDRMHVLQPIFRVWKAWAMENHEEQMANEKKCNEYLFAKKKALFHDWALMSNALQLFKIKSESKIFYAWKDFVQHRTDLKRKMEKKKLNKKINEKKQIFTNWRDTVKQQQEAKQMSQILLSNRAKGILHKWRDFAGKQKDLKDRFESCGTIAIRQERMVNDVFLKWKDLMSSKRVAKIKKELDKKVKMRILERWLDEVQNVQRCRNLLKQQREKKNFERKQETLRNWQDLVRSQQFYCTNTKKQILIALKSAVKKQKQWREAKDVYGMRFNASVLARHMHQWIELYKRNKRYTEIRKEEWRLKMEMEALAQKHSKFLKKIHFVSWKKRIEEKREKREKSKRMQEKNLLSKAIKGWVNFHKMKQKQKKIEEIIAQKKKNVLLKKCFEALRQYSNIKAYKTRVLPKLLHEKALEQRQRLFVEWRLCFQNIEHRREIENKAMHHFKEKITRTALRVWQQANAEAAERKRRAEAMHMQKTEKFIHNIFQKWKEFSSQRTLTRNAINTFQEIQRKKHEIVTRKLAASAFSAWKNFSRVQNAAYRLNEKQTVRITKNVLQKWHQQSQHVVALRELKKKADSRYRLKVMMSSFTGWRDALQQTIQAQENKIAEAVGRLEANELRHLIHNWKLFVIQCKRRQSAIKQMQTFRLTQFFARWKQFSSLQLSYKQKIWQVQRFHDQCLLSKAWFDWITYAQAMRGGGFTGALTGGAGSMQPSASKRSEIAVVVDARGALGDSRFINVLENKSQNEAKSPSIMRSINLTHKAVSKKESETKESELENQRNTPQLHRSNSLNFLLNSSEKQDETEGNHTTMNQYSALNTFNRFSKNESEDRKFEDRVTKADSTVKKDLDGGFQDLSRIYHSPTIGIGRPRSLSLPYTSASSLMIPLPTSPRTPTRPLFFHPHIPIHQPTPLSEHLFANSSSSTASPSESMHYLASNTSTSQPPSQPSTPPTHLQRTPRTVRFNTDLVVDSTTKMGEHFTRVQPTHSLLFRQSPFQSPSTPLSLDSRNNTSQAVLSTPEVVSSSQPSTSTPSSSAVQISSILTPLSPTMHSIGAISPTNSKGEAEGTSIERKEDSEEVDNNIEDLQKFSDE